MTTQESDRKTWLERRKAGIGGSDAAAAVGMSQYKTRLELYEEKIAPVTEAEAEAVSQNPDIERGRAFEAFVASRFATRYSEDTGREIALLPCTEQIAHPDYPWMIANPDRLIVVAGQPEADGVLEVKVPRSRNFLRWKREGVPIEYVIQLQHYLVVQADIRFGAFAYFNFDAMELIRFEVERDPVIRDALIEQEGIFWTQHVVPRVPPEEIVGDLPVILPDVAKGELVRMTTENWTEAVRDFMEARATREIAEQLEDAAKSNLKTLMEQAEATVAEGAGLRVYWKPRAGSTTFDRRALEANRPLDRNATAIAIAKLLQDRGLVLDDQAIVELVEDCALDLSQFTKTGAPSRPFTPYILKNPGGLE